MFGLLSEVDGLVRERDESDGENGIGRGAIESQRTTETRPETSGAGTLSWRGGEGIKIPSRRTLKNDIMIRRLDPVDIQTVWPQPAPFCHIRADSSTVNIIAGALCASSARIHSRTPKARNQGALCANEHHSIPYTRVDVKQKRVFFKILRTTLTKVLWWRFSSRI